MISVACNHSPAEGACEVCSPTISAGKPFCDWCETTSLVMEVQAKDMGRLDLRLKRALVERDAAVADASMMRELLIEEQTLRHEYGTKLATLEEHMRQVSPRHLVAADDLVRACLAAVRSGSHATDCAGHHGEACSCWLTMAKAALERAGVEQAHDTEAL